MSASEKDLNDRPDDDHPTRARSAEIITFDEKTLERVWPQFVAGLHPTVLGTTSGALKAVERSLPSLLNLLLNKEGGQ